MNSFILAHPLSTFFRGRMGEPSFYRKGWYLLQWCSKKAVLTCFGSFLNQSMQYHQLDGQHTVKTLRPQKCQGIVKLFRMLQVNVCTAGVTQPSEPFNNILYCFMFLYFIHILIHEIHLSSLLLQKRLPLLLPKQPESKQEQNYVCVWVIAKLGQSRKLGPRGRLQNQQLRRGNKTNSTFT